MELHSINEYICKGYEVEVQIGIMKDKFSTRLKYNDIFKEKLNQLNWKTEIKEENIVYCSNNYKCVNNEWILKIPVYNEILDQFKYYTFKLCISEEKKQSPKFIVKENFKLKRTRISYFHPSDIFRLDYSETDENMYLELEFLNPSDIFYWYDWLKDLFIDKIYQVHKKIYVENLQIIHGKIYIKGKDILCVGETKYNYIHDPYFTYVGRKLIIKDELLYNNSIFYVECNLLKEESIPIPLFPDFDDDNFSYKVPDSPSYYINENE